MRKYLEEGFDPPSTEALPAALVLAVERLIALGSGPDLGIVPALLERRVMSPEVPVAALQGADGYDARTWANSRVYPVLAWLKDSTGGKVKLSKDAGVSNPYREKAIDQDWLARRKNDQKYVDLLTVAELLPATRDDDAATCLEVAAARLVERFRSSQLTYRVPRRVSPAEATRIIDDYVRAESSGGRRLECVMAASAKTVLSSTWPTAVVTHSDPNDPEMCDIVVTEGGVERLLVEVTDSSLTVSKLREEVVERLQLSGTACHAIVIAPGVQQYEEDAVTAYIERLFNEAGLTISVLSPSQAIYYWMALYANENLQLELLHAIGAEIDEYGLLSDRRGWREALDRYWDRTTGVG